MADSQHEEQSVKRGDNRRRTLLVALLGAGVPLSQRVLPGEWTAPVVDAVLLPAHAQTSPGNPVGSFGSGIIGNAPGPSLIENIVQRTEEEILDFFVNAAEANSCDTNSACDTNGTLEVRVVATISQNPSTNECVQARVLISGSSCSSSCQIFDFDAAVDGQSVSIADNCELTLSGMTLAEDGLSGNWSYSSGNLSDSGVFNAPRNDAGGCGTLNCFS